MRAFHSGMDTHFESDIFPVQVVELDGQSESVLVGGRHLLPLLPEALRGIEEIAVLGWGSQGQAQAQNLRDSLAGTDIRVSVGLRAGSASVPEARAAGFTEEDDTLCDMFDLARRADLVLLLIADAAQVELYPEIVDSLRPGTTLGLSHGFLIAHLQAAGESLPPDVNVIGVCPKGMGPSVRRLYQQGIALEGAGINASFAVEQDVDGWATDIALAWAVAIGAPYTFKTTFGSEARSDIFGERGVLLGAVHGIVEALYRRARENGADEEDAFERACESLTGPIARAISSRGPRGLYETLSESERRHFSRAYSATYAPACGLLAEIYDEVDSGRELQSVIAAGGRLERHPMGTVEGTRMWQVGAAVRARRHERHVPIDPYTAGVFVAVMTAQIDLLREKGHPWSEVANESVIEAVDSLIPYMHARGVAYMVDNCSTTARLGARKWGPLFEATLTRIALPASDAAPADPSLIERFLSHPMHDVLATLREFRPPVDIAVE